VVNAPRRVPVVDVRRDVLRDAADGAFAEEGGRLFYYYTLLGPDALEQHGGPRQETRFLNTAKVEVDPETLALVGPPAELLEQPGTTFAVDISRDGLWMVYTCFALEHGVPPREGMLLTDICVARRDRNTDPWSGHRVLTEMSTRLQDTDPTFHNDPSGAPDRILFVSNVDDDSEICAADFDVAAAAVDFQGNATRGVAVRVPTDFDGRPRCQPLQPPGQPNLVPISEEGVFETCPQWSADQRHFLWARRELGGNYDLWLGRSSGGDGNVDVFIGQLEINSADQQLGIATAPAGPDGRWGGIIAWHENMELVPGTGDPVRLNFARVPDYDDAR
jgi:hypothetical protein